MEMEIDNAETKMDQSNIKEGCAEILTQGHVFYNPVQEFNRDISISVITTFSKLFEDEIKKERSKRKSFKVKSEENAEIPVVTIEEENNGGFLRILEALSASGLRSVRYAKEIPGVKEIITNDLSKQAVESIKLNAKHNNVEHLVTPSHSDAMTLMYLSTTPDKKFTVVDLDPYGCPSRFLDGAVQSVEEGGLLLITATDMAVLCGNTPEACYSKYGSIPLKTKACHEMALRLLLKCIESHANRYGRYIKPLLSISADFYIRVFVRIFTSSLACKKSCTRQSVVFQCTGCNSFTLQPLGVSKATEAKPNSIKFGIPTGPFVQTNCQHCNHKHHMGGPIWSDPIHDINFVTSLLETVTSDSYAYLGTQKRIIGMLSVITEELQDVPLYYTIESLCSTLKLEVVPMLTFRSAILHAGYNVSFSHACKSSIKTNAPAAVIWDILKCWAKIHPVKQERMIEGTPLKAIFAKECLVEHNLTDMHPLANPGSRKECLSRFPLNPSAHWGPGTRATFMVGEDKMLKSVRCQNKNKNKRFLKNEKTTPEHKHVKLDTTTETNSEL